MSGWMDPFGNRPPPFAKVPRDPHGHPRRRSESSRELNEAMRGFVPISRPQFPDHSPPHLARGVLPGASQPPPLLHRHTEPIFQYPELASPPGYQPAIYYSSAFRGRALPDPEWDDFPGEPHEIREETTLWQDWPPRRPLPARYGPNGAERHHILHPFLAGSLPCRDISSTIWDILDFPTHSNVLCRWTSANIRVKVAANELDAIATYPSSERMIIHFAEGVPPLEIARAAADKPILLKDVLVAIYKHLNGKADDKGEGGSYIPQASFDDFHDELKYRTRDNCIRRRKFLFSRTDVRREIEPPKWIDTLGHSATKFVGLSVVREVDEGTIICELVTCPGKIASE